MRPEPVADAQIAVRLGALTSLLLLFTLGGLMVVGAFDPVQMLLPGEKGAGGSVMVEDFGNERIPDGYSYDGQQYYLAARHFPDIEAAGDVMGGPRYRLLRIGLPALASPAGEGTGVVLLLIGWNIVGTGLAVGSLADLARRHGRPARVGAAAGMALALPLLLTTAECLAFGLGFFALALAHRGRLVWALLALAAAGLTRETALTFAAGMLALWVVERRIRAVLALPLAALPLLIWRLHLHRSLPDGEESVLGFFELLDIGHRPVPDQVITVAVLFLGAAAVVHWRDAVIVSPVAFAFLVWFLAYEYNTYDWRALLRVSAPLVALGLAGVASWWLTGSSTDAHTRGQLGGNRRRLGDVHL